MTKEIGVSFSNAAKEVFQTMLDIETSAEAPLAPTDEKSADTLYVSIGITGDLTGKVYYSFPRTMALEIVKIMSGMEFKEVDDFVLSAMSEIVNIISGNALTDLAEQTVSCDLTPPEVLRREDLPTRGGSRPVPAAILKSAIGDAKVGIALSRTE